LLLIRHDQAELGQQRNDHGDELAVPVALVTEDHAQQLVSDDAVIEKLAKLFWKALLTSPTSANRERSLHETERNKRFPEIRTDSPVHVVEVTSRVIESRLELADQLRGGVYERQQGVQYDVFTKRALAEPQQQAQLQTNKQTNNQSINQTIKQSNKKHESKTKKGNTSDCSLACIMVDKKSGTTVLGILKSFACSSISCMLTTGCLVLFMVS